MWWIKNLEAAELVSAYLRTRTWQSPSVNVKVATGVLTGCSC